MKTKKPKPKVIAIVGPTASGKSDLAIKIAKRFNGEIISADSRQVYRGMDIGSGKVPGSWKPFPKKRGRAKKEIFFYKNIPHYGIDTASPKRQYSVAQFKKYAEQKIDDIVSRGKVPIICGGTGHWIDSLLLNQSFPEVRPNYKLRKTLEKKSVDDLFALLKQRDLNRAKTIDPKNPRRLIRALEIIYSTKKHVPPLSKGNSDERYNTVWMGILPPFDILEQKIKKRLMQRIKQGMLKEIKTLHDNGVSWKRLESFGLEYKYGALLLQNNIDKKTFEKKLYTEIRRYAKRQLTWFKRNLDIRWIQTSKEAFEIIKNNER